MEFSDRGLFMAASHQPTFIYQALIDDARSERLASSPTANLEAANLEKANLKTPDLATADLATADISEMVGQQEDQLNIGWSVYELKENERLQWQRTPVSLTADEQWQPDSQAAPDLMATNVDDAFEGYRQPIGENWLDLLFDADADFTDFSNTISKHRIKVDGVHITKGSNFSHQLKHLGKDGYVHAKHHGNTSTNALNRSGLSSSEATCLLDNVRIVEKVAKDLGVDPVLAVATMLVESGGNKRAIGDGGTSFGLFQLHRGGELGHLSARQAFIPEINARTALSVFAHQQNKISDPGWLAARAQRPANAFRYAAKVDASMTRARSLLAQAHNCSFEHSLASG